jgi:H/ACA ribonucleoprotein complex subunit 1
MQRGGGRGGFRGGRGGDRGRGGGRGFGGGRGGGRGWVDYGPPDTVVEAGVFEHPCEGEAVCKLSIEKARRALACGGALACAGCRTS